MATVGKRTAGKTVCLLGDADLLRPIGLGGLRAIVMADSGSPLRRSRFVAGGFPSIDAYAEPERLIAKLVEVGRRLPDPPVLYYQFDRHLLAISRQREALRPVFRFHLPPADLVEDLVDKVRFQVLAERLRLPVPPGMILSPLTGEIPANESIGFPAIAKPAARDDRWAAIEGAAKAVLVQTVMDLDRMWRTWRAADLTIVVQELIPGDERRIESYHAYVSTKGHALGEFTGRKIRTRPRHFGHTTALEITASPDVLELGREIRRRLALRGVMKMDFKRDPAGRLHLLEINPASTSGTTQALLPGSTFPCLSTRI